MRGERGGGVEGCDMRGGRRGARDETGSLESGGRMAGKEKTRMTAIGPGL